jgi:hypothetical protein
MRRENQRPSEQAADERGYYQAYCNGDESCPREQALRRSVQRAQYDKDGNEGGSGCHEELEYGCSLFSNVFCHQRFASLNKQQHDYPESHGNSYGTSLADEHASAYGCGYERVVEQYRDYGYANEDREDGYESLNRG